MAATARPISNIAMAFAAAGGTSTATTTSSFSPNDNNNNNNNTNALSASLPITQPSKMGDHPLPTPPNSISPTLPPHRVRDREHHHLAASSSHPPHIQVDYDMDIQTAEPSPDSGDMGDHLGPHQPLSSAALSALSAPDPTGAITPQMLAAHHLPEVLLANGPIAIRYVLAHLTQSVPGFARIPPAKARRLVVAALESRVGGGERGEIVFEKVGWGRWDARRRGEPSRHASTAGLSIPRADALSPPASIPGSYALSSAGDHAQIPLAAGARVQHRSRRWSASNRDGSASTSGGGGLDMWAEHQADNMSLDGSFDDDDDEEDSPDYRRHHHHHGAEPRIKELPIDEGDSDDATDEEDWAGMGAAALRQASLSVPKSSCVAYPRGGSAAAAGLSSSTRMKTHPGVVSAAGSGVGVGSDHMARSVPMPVPARPQQWRENRHVASSAGSRAASRRGSSSFHPYATSADQRGRGSSVQHGVRGMEMIVDTEGAGTQEREAIEALLRMGGR